MKFTQQEIQELEHNLENDRIKEGGGGDSVYNPLLRAVSFKFASIIIDDILEQNNLAYVIEKYGIQCDKGKLLTRLSKFPNIWVTEELKRKLNHYNNDVDGFKKKYDDSIYLFGRDNINIAPTFPFPKNKEVSFTEKRNIILFKQTTELYESIFRRGWVKSDLANQELISLIKENLSTFYERNHQLIKKNLSHNLQQKIFEYYAPNDKLLDNK